MFDFVEGHTPFGSVDRELYEVGHAKVLSASEASCGSHQLFVVHVHIEWHKAKFLWNGAMSYLIVLKIVNLLNFLVMINFELLGCLHNHGGRVLHSWWHSKVVELCPSLHKLLRFHSILVYGSLELDLLCEL